MEENKEVEVLGEEKVIEQSQPEVKESFVENKEEPVEPNTPIEPNKKGNNKKIITIILIIVAGLCIVGAVVFFVFFNHSDKDDEDSNEPEVVEKKDTDTDNKSSDTKKTSSYVFYMNEFNSDIYDYSVKKNLTTTDTIDDYDLKNEKEIKYTFTIENKSVVASNSYGSKYAISKINNAKQLLVTSMGQDPEYNSAFVITDDNKLYSIRLYANNNMGQIITDCTKLEDTTTQLLGDVKNITSGTLTMKNTTGGEGIALIETNDNKKYILTTSEKIEKIISKDQDLTDVYISTDNKDNLTKSSRKMADLYNIGLKVGNIKDLDKSQVTLMTILYLEGKWYRCFDSNYLKEKAKQLFDVDLSDKDVPNGVTFEDNRYCVHQSFGSFGGPGPNFDIKSNVSEKDGSITYEYVYSYDEMQTTITLEYKLKNNHYILESASKK